MRDCNKVSLNYGDAVETIHHRSAVKVVGFDQKEHSVIVLTYAGDRSDVNCRSVKKVGRSVF